MERGLRSSYYLEEQATESKISLVTAKKIFTRLRKDGNPLLVNALLLRIIEQDASRPRNGQEFMHGAYEYYKGATDGKSPMVIGQKALDREHQKRLALTAIFHTAPNEEALFDFNYTWTRNHIRTLKEIKTENPEIFAQLCQADPRLNDNQTKEPNINQTGAIYEGAVFMHNLFKATETLETDNSSSHSHPINVPAELITQSLINHQNDLVNRWTKNNQRQRLSEEERNWLEKAGNTANYPSQGFCKFMIDIILKNLKAKKIKAPNAIDIGSKELPETIEEYEIMREENPELLRMLESLIVTYGARNFAIIRSSIIGLYSQFRLSLEEQTLQKLFT